MRGSSGVLPALLGVLALLLPGGSRVLAQETLLSLRPGPSGFHSVAQPGSRASGISVAGGATEAAGRPFLTSQGHLRRTVEPGTDLPQTFQASIPGPGRAFLLSSLVPGMGQRVQGQDRWIAYVAGEAWAWTQFIHRRRDGHALQKRYRDLAWLVARRVSSGRRVDGDFEYYEAMTQYASSGAYDADPATPGVQPELDPKTYNGSMWILAKQIFFLEDPEEPIDKNSTQYEDALKYYRSRAYSQSFSWNWGTNSLEQGEFSALIKASDDRLKRSTTMIGVILANHLLSAVDALVSGRLGQVDTSTPHLQLMLTPGPFHQDSYVLTFRIPSL